MQQPEHPPQPGDSLTRRYWLPHPALSLFMWLLWLLMVNNLSAGHMVLAAFFAWVIPYLTQAFWPASGAMRKPLLAMRLILVILWDIVLANVSLAVRILGPQRKLQPAFMELPLDIKDDFTITLLASTISLTPGTVSADLNSDNSKLLIHTLYVDDIDAAIAELKRRYEAPLKEIFECSQP